MYSRAMILHISCHGFKDNQEKKGFRMGLDNREDDLLEGYYLLFETEKGLGESISAK